MVERFFRTLEKPVRGLHQAAYVLGGFALFSQLLALLRDRMLAGEFGVGATLDIYYTAFRIPDFLFATVASLLSLYAVLPSLTRFCEESEGKGVALVERLLLLFFAVIGFISLVLFIAAPRLVPLVAPGFDEASLADLTLLTRIILLQPILLGASNLLASLTQFKRRFILYAASPVLYNLGIIAGILLLYPQLGIAGLAWGVVLGAFLHLAVQVPSFFSMKAAQRTSYRIPMRVVGEILLLSFPRTLALAAGQITLFALIALASSLREGTVSVFTFSLNLQSVPLTIIGVSYSIAAFPTLAAAFARGHREEFALHIRSALRHLIFWSIPAAVLFIVLRAQIVRVILGYGAFDWEATRLTAAALAVLIVSLLAQGVTLLLTRGYYAAGKTLSPLIFAGVSVAASVTSAIVFLHVFQTHEGIRYFIESLLRIETIEGTEALMLALGYALGSILQAILLFIFFVREFSLDTSSLARSTLQSFAAAVGGGAAAYGVLAAVGSLVDINTFLGILSQGLAGGIVGGIVTFLLLLLLRNQELGEVLASLRKRTRQSAEVAAEPSELSS